MTTDDRDVDGHWHQHFPDACFLVVIDDDHLRGLGRGRFMAKFWVCGTLKVRDGKITLWRDYFDWLTLTSSLVRAIPGMLFTR